MNHPTAVSAPVNLRLDFGDTDVARLLQAAHDALLALYLIADDEADETEVDDAYERAVDGLQRALFVEGDA